MHTMTTTHRETGHDHVAAFFEDFGPVLGAGVSEAETAAFLRSLSPEQVAFVRRMIRSVRAKGQTTQGWFSGPSVPDAAVVGPDEALDWIEKTIPGATKALRQQELLGAMLELLDVLDMTGRRYLLNELLTNVERARKGKEPTWAELLLEQVRYESSQRERAFPVEDEYENAVGVVLRLLRQGRAVAGPMDYLTRILALADETTRQAIERNGVMRTSIESLIDRARDPEALVQVFEELREQAGQQPMDYLQLAEKAMEQIEGLVGPIQERDGLDYLIAGVTYAGTQV